MTGVISFPEAENYLFAIMFKIFRSHITFLHIQ